MLCCCHFGFSHDYVSSAVKMHKMQFRAFLMIELAALPSCCKTVARSARPFNIFTWTRPVFFPWGGCTMIGGQMTRFFFAHTQGGGKGEHRKILGIIIGNNELVYSNGMGGKAHIMLHVQCF